jgi:cell division protein ZapA (FtsZ GTPase activity inhibitor)
MCGNILWAIGGTGVGVVLVAVVASVNEILDVVKLHRKIYKLEREIAELRNGRHS